jgi:hypothetical protein
MKPLKIITSIMVVGLIFAYGCYPGGPANVDDYTIVRTQYNTAYEFNQTKYYYMPDSMLFFTNVDDENIDEQKVREYEIELLSAIETNLNARGFERVDTTAPEIDLVVLPSSVLSQNKGAAWWPGYGWWGGYYPPGWGWGGGWYYPPGWGGYWTYYSYSTGTVFIDIADYDSFDPDAETSIIEIEWEALIDGLFQGVDKSKITPLVDQAFEQSPYLVSN